MTYLPGVASSTTRGKTVGEGSFPGEQSIHNPLYNNATPTIRVDQMKSPVASITRRGERVLRARPARRFTQSTARHVHRTRVIRALGPGTVTMPGRLDVRQLSIRRVSASDRDTTANARRYSMSSATGIAPDSTIASSGLSEISSGSETRP